MKTFLIALTALACCFISLDVIHGDTIKMVDGGKHLKIRIVKEGIQKVIFKRPGLPDQSIDSSRVLEVIYDVGSNDYKTAMAAFKEGDWETAAKLYEEYGDSLGSDKEALQAHCLFNAAECYMNLRNWKKGVESFTYFANNFKDHRKFPNALLKRAQCYINDGDMKKAQDGFNTLKGQVDKKRLGDYWKYTVEFWLIRIRENADLKRALNDYKSLYSSVSDKIPSVANDARLQIGTVLMKQKKWGEASSFFSEIIENRADADQEVVAGAFLGRGKCKLNKPKATNEEIKSALYDLLRVVVHYEDVGAFQAEAMYYAGKCFQILGGKDAAKRWQSLYRKLQREWAGTDWATEAGRELGN